MSSTRVKRNIIKAWGLVGWKRLGISLLFPLLFSGSTAFATIHLPDYQFAANGPLPEFEAGQPYSFSFTLLVREDLYFSGLRSADKVGAGNLIVAEEPAKAMSGPPAGYAAYGFVASGTYDPAVELNLELGLDSDWQAVPLELGRETKTLSPDDFDIRIEPALPGAEKALRTVTVFGRIVMEVVPARDGNPAQIEGVDGAKVKIMEPVDFLDDNTLAEDGTGLDGYFSFQFQMDGTKDIYFKVEAANDFAVNVGTGLFFSTYNRQIPFDDFSGSSIDLGELSYRGDFNNALYVTHAITRAQRAVAAEGLSLSRVHVRYPDDSRNTSWYLPLGGLEGIHLRRDRGRNTGSIYHEYGHHFVTQRATSIPPDYCNGVCERGTCGHCYWCAENEATAWSEGFPNWLSWYLAEEHLRVYDWALPGPRNTESLAACTEPGGMGTPRKVEGYVAALIQDLVDADNDNDTFVDSTWADVTEFDPSIVFRVATNRGPTTSYDFVREFHEQLKIEPTITTQDIANYWSTVRNNGLAEDDIPPTSFTAVSSPTHPVGVSSPNAYPSFIFSGGTDDLTGIQGAFVTITATPTIPGGGGGEFFVGTSGVWPYPLPEGSWYANVLALDGAGNQSSGWISYGPIVIASPQPVDLVPGVGQFWENELIVRNTPDATAQTAGWPTTLQAGDAYASLFIKNESLGSGFVDSFRVRFDLAGETVATRWVIPGTLTPGKEIPVINVGPFTLPAGRQTLVASIDDINALAELDEGNNFVAVDLRIEPTPIFIGGSFSMPYPGKRLAGEGVLGYTPDNMVAVRLTPGTTYTVVESDPIDLYAQSGIQAFEPVAGPLVGLETRLGGISSEFRHRRSFLVLNRDAWPGPSMDVGVHYLSWAAESGLELRTYAPATHVLPSTGDLVLNYSLLPDSKIYSFEIEVQPGSLGYLEIQLEALFDLNNEKKAMYGYWIPPGQPAVGLNPRDFDLRTTRGEPGTLLLDLPAAGKYLLLLVESGIFPGNPTGVTGTVTLTRTERPELRLPAVDPIWDVGLLPTNLEAQDDTLNFPTELLGGVAGTYVNFVIENDSWFDSPVAPAELMLEGATIEQIDLGVIQAGERKEFRASVPVTIPAGRRTLALVIDPYDQVDERLEGNNTFALQYGWRGPELYPGQPLFRDAPPPPNALMNEVEELFTAAETFEGEDGEFRQITFRAPDCDGLRLDGGLLKSGGSWIGASAMPVDGALEVGLYDANVPVNEAYVHPLATSNWGDRKGGYVLAYQESGPEVFDVGIVDAGSAGQYDVHAALSQDLGAGTLGQAFGPYTMNAGESLQLYEFDLEPGTYAFILFNYSLDARMGLGIHAPRAANELPYHGKDDLLLSGTPNGWAGGPGEQQVAQIEVAEGEGGKYCLAVWKQGTAERNISVQYGLAFGGQVAAASPIAIDGVVDPVNYGYATILQEVETEFGDNDDGSVDQANGSELDGAYALIENGWLYLMLTGNLESNGNDLEIFLDTRPGGQNRLRGDNSDVASGALNRMGDDGTGNGLTFDPSFSPDWYLTASGNLSGGDNSSPPYLMDLHLAELATNGGGDGWLLGAAEAGRYGTLFGPAPEVENPWGIRAAISNANTAGVPAGTGPSTGSGVTTGFEVAIPLAALGDPQGCIQVSAFINGRLHDFVSNQVLGSLPAGTANLGEPRDVDFGAHAGDQYFVVCAAGASDVGDEDPRVPDLNGRFAALHLPAPNPFNPQTALSFTLSRAAAVELSIYDAAGREVRRLLNSETFESGFHSVTWRGEDNGGRRVASGVYFVQMQAGDERQVQRVVLVQ